MKAIVCTKFGSPDVLQLREVEKPVPGDNEILVRIHATTVTPGDCRIRSFTVPPLFWLAGRMALGFRKPKNPILGMELAGEIESVGKDVKLFKKGDQVFGSTYGLGFGSYAEYKCIPEDGMVAMKPANMSYEEAAGITFGGNSALWFLREGNIKSGQKVLIYGASGGVGTFAVQLAKYFGAEVTGVDSTNKLDMIRSIGADHVIDYTKEDFTKGGQRYDLIVDVVVHRSVFDYKRALSPKGICVFIGGSMTRVFINMLLGPFISMTGSKKMGLVNWEPNKKEDLVFLKELFEAVKVVPVIDRRYPLSEVPEAFRYLEEGHAKGKVVITVEHNDKT